MQPGEPFRDGDQVVVHGVVVELAPPYVRVRLMGKNIHVLLIDPDTVDLYRRAWVTGETAMLSHPTLGKTAVTILALADHEAWVRLSSGTKAVVPIADLHLPEEPKP